MRARLLVAISLLGLLAFVIFIGTNLGGRNDDLDVEVPAESAQEDPESAGEVLTRTSSVAREERVRTTSTPKSDERERSAGSLLVRSRFASDRAPVVSTALRLILPGSTGIPRTRVGITDEDGTYLFENVDTGTVQLQLLAGAFGEATIVPREQVEVELIVNDDVTIHGVVVDPDGFPVGGAQILVSAGMMPEMADVLAHSQSDGSYRIRCAGGFAYIGAMAAGFGPSLRYPIVENAGAVIERRLELRGKGGAVQGRIVDVHGGPVPEAWILLGSGQAKTRQDPETELHLRHPTSAYARSDGEGGFRAAGLPIGTLPVLVRHPRYAVWAGETVIQEDRDAEVIVQLTQGAVVHGRIEGQSGEPLADAWVTVEPEALAAFGPVVLRTFWCRTRSDGTYRIEGLPAGELALEVSHDSGVRSRSKRSIGEREELEWNIRFEEGTVIRGLLLDEHDVPLENWTITARTERSIRGYGGANARTDAEGRFTVQNVRDLPHTIAAIAPDSRFPSLVQEDVHPSEEDLKLRVSSAGLPRLWISGRVVGPDLVAVERGEISVVDEARRGSIVRVLGPDMLGSFRIGPLPPGEFALEIDKTGFPHKGPIVCDLTHGVDLELGTIQLAAFGRVLVHARNETGGELGRLWIRVLSKDGAKKGTVPMDGLIGRSVPLEAGAYVLSVEGDGILTHTLPFEIAVDRETRLEVTLQIGVDRWIDVRIPSGESAPDRYNARVFDEAGMLVLDEPYEVDRERLAAEEPDASSGTVKIGWVFFNLRPGSYRLEVTAEGGFRTSLALTLGPDPPAEELGVILRR